MHKNTSASNNLFRSFWAAGYEGSDLVWHDGRALAMNELTHHAHQVQEDYALLSQFGIKTVRETVGWRLVEQHGRFDMSSLALRARTAQEMGLQIQWTFCQYGWPADVDLFSPQFVERFARFCHHVATYLAPFCDDAPIYSPINEISYMSWGLSARMFQGVNHAQDPGEEGKRQLVRATIAGCDAIWAADPRARILQCDPIIHVVAPDEQSEWEVPASNWRESQFDAWDMLCGRKQPELGGHPRYLDLVGVNFYHDNQWEAGSNARLHWHLGDARRKALHQLLTETYQRYQRPLYLAETSHVGSGRGTWIREIAQQAALAVQHGVDLQGICIYPIIDRPDWQDTERWHQSGLWDVDLHAEKPFQRVLCQPYATALRQAQRLTDNLCFTHTPPRQQGDSMPAIIVFSHLRWDFVYQRPQQLLTRLAEKYQIVFIEEPIYHEGECFMKLSNPAPNILVCQPHTPIKMTGFHDDQLPSLRKLVKQLGAQYDNPVAWFYTPMALPLLQELHPSLVVYDCMDELSAFTNPPKQLLQRESALLKVADLVFTGGPSLYQAKRERHANVHCFSSSVDVVHFEQALDRSNHHPLHADIPHPRLGYYGVIDERFDTEMVAQLADAHPDWNIVLVGPVVKIDPATLPQRDNIYYLGQQPYQALPQFLAGWDVCLMPFAMNEATRFISPTKTLEYMAAQLPIVSTPITDVAVPYGHIVAIAGDAPSFVAHCEQALAFTPEQLAEKTALMRQVMESTSWDVTAQRMADLLASNMQAQNSNEQVAAAPLVASAAGVEQSGKVNPLRTAASMQSVSCVIIGSGPTGLSAAYHLGEDTLVLDKNASVGGWCRSIDDKGFTFDYAGHIMFSNDPYVHELYKVLLGDNVHWQDREAWVYSKGVHTRYPFQGALYGLPPAVIKECVMGAIEARYGQTDKVEAASVAQCAPGKAPDDCCADGTADLNTKESVPAAQAGPKNFEEFIYKVWGAGIAKHFAIPYNKKIWTVPLTEMETSWLGGRVPLPDLEQMLDGALQPVGKPMGPNARFGYPLKGGFQALMSGFLPHIKGKLEQNANVVKVSPREHIVALADGRRFKYDQLVSTMPLPELIKKIGDEVPLEVQQAARGLKHISIRCVNLGIARENITDKHWIYYPEDSIFHRIFVQGNASPDCNPPGGFGLTCEISYSPWKPLPVDGQALVERCMADLVKVGLLNPEDQLITSNLVDMPYAYVVYDHDRARNVATVKEWLSGYDIILAGRYSEWEYYNSDHAFLAGKKAAETVASQWVEPKKGTLAES